MLNKIQEGNVIDVVLTADANPGDVLVVGDLVGVVISGGLDGDTVAVAYNGVYELPKATSAGSGIAQGKIVYWDPAVPGVTATAGSLKTLGKVWRTAADADATVYVRLLG